MAHLGVKHDGLHDLMPEPDSPLHPSFKANTIRSSGLDAIAKPRVVVERRLVHACLRTNAERNLRLRTKSQ